MGTHVCRRLMLFLDGTWNEDLEDRPASNIVYLRERLFWGLQTRRRERDPRDQDEFQKLPDEMKKKAMRAMVFDGFEYVVYYHRGVGTGPFLDRFKGGVFGSGLEQNVRRAYNFLSSQFRPGDEIFIFGFSRGAFTARSLCGYLSAVGLLKSECCTRENESLAWSFYRTAPADRLSADWHYFRRPGNAFMHDDSITRVRALCVFDTVGARGIPAAPFRRFNRSKFEFHNTDISSSVDIRLHALSIDEPRWAFEPAIWTKPKFEMIDGKVSPTEQAWFSGAHSDIGGGYVQWNHGEHGLSHLALSWMLQRLRYHLVNTPPRERETPPDLAVPANVNAPIPFYTDDLFDRNEPVPILKEPIRKIALKSVQHEPGKLWRLAFWRNRRRLINQIETKDKEDVGRIPFADPIGEMIHVSALERLKPYLAGSTKLHWWLRRLHKEHEFYYPGNLIYIIPFIAATYLKTKAGSVQTPWKDEHIIGEMFSWKQIQVADWDGRPLDPDDEKDVKRLFDEILPTPAQLKLRRMPREMVHMHGYIQKVKSAGGSTRGF
jgi:uncharacterized protein (DUF2235 family)